jgi:hypothetical protein
MRPVIAGSEFSIGVKVPGQQLTDAIDGVIGDSGRHHSQVGFWITVVQLCCSYQCRALEKGLVGGRRSMNATTRYRPALLKSCLLALLPIAASNNLVY